MLATQPHPSPDDLKAFGQGRLDPVVAEAIEQHVAGCDSCCQYLADTPADSFVGRLRQAERVTLGTTADGPGGGTLADASAIPPELIDHPRYRVLGLIGQGGMGAVYKAEHRHMERPVALKVINPALLRNPATVRRFQQEVKATARLHHPNIVAAYDADQAGDRHFLVVEYVEGATLAQRLSERGPLPIAEACEYARQAALGLQHLHEAGLIHRDVKPHNMMVTPGGTVKLLDCGLARFAQEPEVGGTAPVADAPGSPGLTAAGTIMGTADYVAPEQAADPRAADIRSDIYSLGCTLYEMLTGRPPFPEGTTTEKFQRHAATPMPIPEEWPAGLKAVVARMTAKKPEERYATPAEVADALTSIRRAGSVSDRRMKPSGRSRSRLAAAVLSLAALILAGVVIIRIQTGKGEIEIKTDDPNVEIVTRKGGEIVRIRDPKSGQTWELDTKKLTMRDLEHPDGLALEVPWRGKVTFKSSGGKVVVMAGPPGVPDAVEKKPIRVLDPVELARLPNAADKLQRKDIPEAALIRAGGGDLNEAPAELVAVLGDVAKVNSEQVGDSALAFSPDGKSLASSGDAKIRLWDLATASEVASWGTGALSRHITFSSDGKLLANATADGICVHRVADGKSLYVLDAKTSRVHFSAFSPDGSLLAATSGNDVRVWRVADGKELRILGNQNPVLAVIFSPDGSKLVAAGTGITVWETQTGLAIKHLLVGSLFNFLEWLPDGKTLAAAKSWGGGSPAERSSGKNGVVCHVDLESGQSLKELPAPIPFNRPGSHVLSPGARFVCLYQEDGNFLLTQPGFEPERRRIFRHSPPKDYSPKFPRSAAFSPDGRYFASSNPEGVIFLYRLAEKGQLPELRATAPTARDLAERPNAADALKQSDIPETARAYVGGGDPKKAPPELVAVLGDAAFRCPKLARASAFSPDGKLLAVANGDRVDLFDAATGRYVRALVASGAVVNVAFSPDSRHLATSYGGTGDVDLWDVAAARLVRTLSCDKKLKGGDLLAFSLDGKMLAVASNGTPRSVMAWDVQTGERLLWGGTNIDPFTQLAFSPDGLLLAMQDPQAGEILSWKVPGGGVGKRAEPGQGYGVKAARIEFSPDGKFVATWNGGNIGARDAKGELLWQSAWSTASNGCQLLTFSADGKTLVTALPIPDGGREKHALRRWEVATGKELSGVELSGLYGNCRLALSPDGATVAAFELHKEYRACLYDAATGEPRVTVPGHTVPARTLAFSPDGKVLASGSGIGPVRLWDLATGRQLRTLPGADVAWVAFSPDGRTVFIAQKGGACVTRRVDNEHAKTILPLGHTDGASAWALSPDGQLLATGGLKDNSVRLTRVADGKELRLLSPSIRPRAEPRVDDLAFSPDGRYLACASGYVVKVWEVADGEEKTAWDLDRRCSRVAFSPDGQALHALTSDKQEVWVEEAWVLDWQAKRVLQKRPLPADPSGRRQGPAAFAPAGRLIALCDNKGPLVLAQPGTDPIRRRTFRLSPDSNLALTAVAFSPDGRYVAAGNPSGTICLLRLSERGELPELSMRPPTAEELAERPNAADALKPADVPEVARAYVGGGDAKNVPPELVAVLGDTRFRCPEGEGPMAFSPDGKQIAVANPHSEIRFIDVQTGRLVRQIKSPYRPHLRMAFSPDGRRLVGLTANRDFFVLDAESGKLIRLRRSVGESGVGEFAFSADGKTLLLSTIAGRNDVPPASLEKWDAETWTPTTFSWPGVSPRSFDVNPDGTRSVELVGGQLLIRDLTGPNEPQRIGSGGWRVVLGPDGKRFAVTRPTGLKDDSGPREATVTIHDQEGKVLQTLPVGGVAFLAFTPDGKTLVAVSTTNAVHVSRWNVADGTKLGSVTLDGGNVGDNLVLSPDGKLLARKQESRRQVELFDTATGKPLESGDGHRAPITALAFSPDGKYLAASDTVETKLWDLATGRDVATYFRSPSQRLVFSPDGKLFVRSTNNSFVLHRMPGGQPKHHWEAKGDGIESVAFSPDGSLIATTGGGDDVRLWRTAGYTEYRVLAYPRRARAVIFSPDGSKIIATGDHGIRVWEAQTGLEVKHFLSESACTSPEWLPGGKTLAVVASGTTGRGVWHVDPEAGKVVGRQPDSIEFYPVHAQVLRDVLSPGARFLGQLADRGFLLTQLGSEPSRRRLFQPTTSPASSDALRAVAFSPDGRYLACGTSEGVIGLFRLAERGKAPDLPVVPEK